MLKKLLQDKPWTFYCFNSCILTILSISVCDQLLAYNLQGVMNLEWGVGGIGVVYTFYSDACQELQFHQNNNKGRKILKSILTRNHHVICTQYLFLVYHKLQFLVLMDHSLFLKLKENSDIDFHWMANLINNDPYRSK